METKIIRGMNMVLNRPPNDLLRLGFEAMLYNLHQRGLCVKPSSASYIPILTPVTGDI